MKIGQRVWHKCVLYIIYMIYQRFKALKTLQFVQYSVTDKYKCGTKNNLCYQ